MKLYAPSESIHTDLNEIVERNKQRTLLYYNNVHYTLTEAKFAGIPFTIVLFLCLFSFILFLYSSFLSFLRLFPFFLHLCLSFHHWSQSPTAAHKHMHATEIRKSLHLIALYRLHLIQTCPNIPLLNTLHM